EQYSTVWEQRRGAEDTPRCHVSSRHERPGGWIEQLGARCRNARPILATCHKDLAILEQGRCRRMANRSQASRRSECPARWIEQLRRQRERRGTNSPSDEHLAILEQRRRVQVTRRNQAPRWRRR